MDTAIEAKIAPNLTKHMQNELSKQIISSFAEIAKDKGIDRDYCYLFWKMFFEL